jgi:hypothetical protein
MKVEKYVALLFFLAFVQLCAVPVAQDRSATSDSPNAAVPKRDHSFFVS